MVEYRVESVPLPTYEQLAKKEHNDILALWA